MNGIRGADVPRCMKALLCRPHVDELTQRPGEETPAGADVVDETLCLVLGENGDPPHPGVDTIRQGEVDIAEVSCESDRGLALPPGQLAEPGTIAAGENECNRLPRQISLESILCSHHRPRPSLRSPSSACRTTMSKKRS